MTNWTQFKMDEYLKRQKLSKATRHLEDAALNIYEAGVILSEMGITTHDRFFSLRTRINTIISHIKNPKKAKK